VNLELSDDRVPVQRRTRGTIEFRYSARAILGERSLPSYLQRPVTTRAAEPERELTGDRRGYFEEMTPPSVRRRILKYQSASSDRYVDMDRVAGFIGNMTPLFLRDMAKAHLALGESVAAEKAFLSAREQFIQRGTGLEGWRKDIAKIDRQLERMRATAAKR
jgi:hypothetical protein